MEPTRAEIDETRIEAARQWIAKQRKLSKVEAWWHIGRSFRVKHSVAEKLLWQERIRRGEITLAELPQHIRRKLIDPANLDLHAIANGPIMNSNEIYLPAGRISLVEAKAREAA